MKIAGILTVKGENDILNEPFIIGMDVRLQVKLCQLMPLISFISSFLLAFNVSLKLFKFIV
ncbi:hypothetical protein CMK15_07685 [Candidatus Poribacteria bacterium]|nr:hypothetical protein [Candidatus Poribacteria bacterium]